MKRIRLLILLFAAMFCSNVLYAQTYVKEAESNEVLFTIGESSEIYLGDVRGEKHLLMGKFEGNNIKLPEIFRNSVISYINGTLYFDGKYNDPLIKIVDGKTYLNKTGKAWNLSNKKVGNNVYTSKGELLMQYTGPVPDKIHAVITLILATMAYTL